MTIKAGPIALAVAFALVTTAGCARKESREATSSTATAPVAAEPAPAPAEADAPSGMQPALGANSWQLVKIMSMDDTTDAPDDPSLYTLEFLADGTMRVRADCNMGTGSWTSESPGQLQFGVIAATQAECPPGSLHDKYMAQFQWVRSYVLENGHLFLATMADGAIIEFEPASAGS
jgi:heat shock protein HslJ